MFSVKLADDFKQVPEAGIRSCHYYHKQHYISYIHTYIYTYIHTYMHSIDPWESQDNRMWNMSRGRSTLQDYLKIRQLSCSFHSALYWILGRKSQLSLENKLLVYKAILKSIWTYGAQLWGKASFKYRYPGKISVKSPKDHHWRTVVCAKYGDTTRPTSPPRQARRTKLQHHLPSPARQPPQEAG